ncbi:MAG: hypothetical protein AB7O80_19350, partial [Acetobacteraceae bacterium]
MTAGPAPPRLALPIDIGLGKSSAARRGIARLLQSTVLASRKIIYSVPRHDLAQEQCDAFLHLGVDAMVWKGRSAPNPGPDDPGRLMCLDPAAPSDAIEVGRSVEQTSCRVVQNGIEHVCRLFHQCGYQAQKPRAAHAQVILCAHHSLFHQAPKEVREVGLLVLDEGFWRAGLRGQDGKAVLTLDGLRTTVGKVICYNGRNRPDWDNTARLMAARDKLWQVLGAASSGLLSVVALRASGLTPEECRRMAELEHRRLRNPGLLPGMDPSERRQRMDQVLPKPGEPWAPPGRAAAMWRLIAEALEKDHDVAGAEMLDAMTENGTVRSLRLQWRAAILTGWGRDAPILHLDATLQPELVLPFIPDIHIAEPVMACQPHVRVRQILGVPTSAKALTPPDDARERERITAANHLRDLATWIMLRAIELRGRNPEGPDVLVIGQKAAIARLESLGLPGNVATVHFNALSGLDHWRHVAGLIILGRTLPPPATVERLAAAISNRPPRSTRGPGTWWYRRVERQIGLSDGELRAVSGDEHDDPLAEAIRWTICEGELIQALGRGRGINRTAMNPLEIDLLTDVALPIAVEEVLQWRDIRPNRLDAMAASGVVLDNAADMARAFPDLWRSHEAAKKETRRTGTNCYYSTLYNSHCTLYNSHLSLSSAVVRYRPSGAGHKDREARFDLAVIGDPRMWLERRLGPLGHFEIVDGCDAAPELETPAEVLDALGRFVWLGVRFDAVMPDRIANDR